MHSHRNIQPKGLQETTEYYLLQLLPKGKLTVEWDQSSSSLVQFWVSTRSGIPKINKATTSRQWPSSTWTIFSEYLTRDLLAATSTHSHPSFHCAPGSAFSILTQKVLKKTAIKIASSFSLQTKSPSSLSGYQPPHLTILFFPFVHSYPSTWCSREAENCCICVIARVQSIIYCFHKELLA